MEIYAKVQFTLSLFVKCIDITVTDAGVYFKMQGQKEASVFWYFGEVLHFIKLIFF